MLPLADVVKIGQVDSTWLNSMAPAGTEIGAKYILSQMRDGNFMITETPDPALDKWRPSGTRTIVMELGAKLRIYVYSERNYPPFPEYVIEATPDGAIKKYLCVEVTLPLMLAHWMTA